MRQAGLTYAQADELIKLANGDKSSALAKVSTLQGVTIKAPKASGASVHVVPSAKPNYRAIWKEAKAAGNAAGERADCVAMVIPGYPVITDGVCGFASLDWDKRTSFGKWAKKNGVGDYHFIGEHRQSLTRKEAHAHAMASVLHSHGVHVHVQSRID